MDVHEPQVRSYNMSRIRSKDTKPEIIVRRFLHSKGLRFKLHDKTLPGKPDLVLPKYKSVVFVHGCFWHLHNGCRFASVPKARTKWWTDKLSKNVERDIDAYDRISSLDWKIMVIWECEINEPKLKALFKEIVKNEK